jgi:acyl-coenzyme A thioesterase PaaI-like protein
VSTNGKSDVSEPTYESLTNSVRRLVDATIRSEAGRERILSAQAKIDAAADELSYKLIPGSFGVQQTRDGHNLAWGNVVIGLRNAIAPPLVVHHEHDGSVWADVTLGAAYEGPPGHVHGGVCALLLDHILGATAHKPGQPAVTGTLTLRYEKATALGFVHAEAHVEHVEGLKTFVAGHLSTLDGVTVRAEGVFLYPRNTPR